MDNRYGSYNDDPVWSRGSGYDVHKQHQPPGFHQSYVPPPTSAPQQTTIIHSSVKPIPDSEIYKVGIYGWRKRCLYIFILILTIIIVINLALTIWIMTVLDFSSDGIGTLKIDDDGIYIKGKTEFEKNVYLSQLSTRDNEALSIDSSMGVFINAHNHTGHTTASLNLNPDGKATAICERFEILDEDRKLLFFVDSQEIGLKLENLRILDDGGTIFEGAIQTARVRPEADTPLSLESPTRNLNIEANQDIEFLSSAGEIQMSSLLDVTLQSKQGDIRLESGNIYVNGLEKSNGAGQTQYQLCVCQNGKLFMANERADCRADRNICE